METLMCQILAQQFSETLRTLFFTKTNQTEKCVHGGGMGKKKADIWETEVSKGHSENDCLLCN